MAATFFVNIRSKLVAIFLLLGLVASPAVAMAGCWTHGSTNSGLPCEPHCPKMAAIMEGMAQTAPSSIAASSSTSACCSLSPSRPMSSMSFGRWRQQARLFAALEMLAQKKSVTEVAIAVGYDSVSAFIEMFRTMLGTTPQSYFRGRRS